MGEKMYSADEKTRNIDEPRNATVRVCEVLSKTTAVLEEIDARLGALFALIGIDPPESACRMEPSCMRDAVTINHDLAMIILGKIGRIQDIL